MYSTDSDFSVDRNEAEFSVTFASDPKNVGRAQPRRGRHHQTAAEPRVPPVVELQRAKALLLAERVLPLDSYTGVADDILRGARDGYVNASEAGFSGWRCCRRRPPSCSTRCGASTPTISCA